MNVTRTYRPDIVRISTATRWIELDEGQAFYETPKAFEIWLDQPLRFVKRIPRSRVYWVITKDEAENVSS